MRKLFVVFLFLVYSATLVLAGKPITPETALQAYLHNNDKSFKWEVKDKLKGDGVTFYQVRYTSQTWQNIKWSHDMMIMVPDVLNYKTALLFITGGSNKNGEPNAHKFTEDLPQEFGKIAKTNQTIIALLWQVPNQPLYDDLTEDALISRTLHNYLEDHDFSWPLLFPMTKSAVRAMDIVQMFSKQEIKKKVTGFVVSGASKRGWTSWLTGANDKRVVAIGPMVIDVLNMPVNIDYQRKVWGDYSIEIEDYVKLGIAQQLGTPGGNDLTKMIDPYSYRRTLTMPKMLFMGTNDPYWPVDAVKNYIDSIPGDNHICYTPNAGHDLGDKKTAFSTLSAFLGNTVTKSKLPVCNYTIAKQDNKVVLTVNTTSELLVDAYLWSSSSTDQDFRNEQWSSNDLNAVKKPTFQVEVELPKSGFKAFYVDLKYKAPFGNDYTQSTRMFVLTDKQLLLKEK
ncbi:MAG: PhoPQ-activated pathogenicity-like protein PqaA type [Prolixibacteraceae bacterium]|nr:PhoPQ-activated pathogenicity-like protein PqaA type [Prolixibacteraceae bacterium]